MNANQQIIKCENCGIKNRIPLTRMKDYPKCGRCGHPLSMPQVYDHVITVSDRTFQSEVLSFQGAVLVDCWAPWCGPCKMVAPVLDQLATEYVGRLKIVKVNVDQNPLTSTHYNIKSIPTLLFFKNGKLEKSLPGAYPKNEIEKQIRLII
jgi:thioredoxin 2